MSFPTDATLTDAGEFGLIRALVEGFRQGEHVLIGPGDDAAVLRVKTGHVVVSTDLMVEGRHFRRDWSAAEDVGHRAAAQNLSDINAMGGRATSLDRARRSRGPARAVGARLRPRLRRRVRPGGRQRRRGRPHPGRPGHRGHRARRLHRAAGGPLRRPAGDVLAITGRQGWAAGGLAVLGRGFRSPRVLVEAYRRPEPPYDAGRVAAEAGATAMIDVSDGLLADARHVADASGVAIDVRRSAFDIPEPRPSGRRWARTRCSSSSAAATTTRCSRLVPRTPSPPAGR